MKGRFLIVGMSALWVVGTATWFKTATPNQEEANPLPTGKAISAVGTHSNVGSYPLNMALSPDCRYAVVTDSGFRQFLSVVRVADGKVVDRVPFNEKGQGLYFGLAFAPDGTLYVSHGAEDRISRYELNGGKLRYLSNDLVARAPKGKDPHNFAGLAVSSDGSRLYVAENETREGPGLVGAIAVFDTSTGAVIRRVTTGGYPLGVATLTRGPGKDRKVYVASERDGMVTVADPSKGIVLGMQATGAKPAYLLLSSDQKTLFVANSGSDTVSFVDTATDKVAATVLLRPGELRGLPGATPLGMGCDKVGKRLYVALGDMNAIAVVDVAKRSLLGYIPTGWYPTSLVLSPDGKTLVAACAKGQNSRIPNAKPVGANGTYIQNIIEGTVSRIPVPSDAALAAYTKTVFANNLIARGLLKPSELLPNPGIKHVIYIIKENRTYDQVLGDVAKGNGDKKLCMFPKEVTPNQHALADRFVLLDNFYVCAEVSMDGWSWSTSGMTTAYIGRNAPYNYSGRGKSYDSEGENSGVAVDLKGIPDVARPSCGYIWEHCLKHGVSVRNYGVFVQSADPNDKRFTVTAGVEQAAANKVALIGRTCPDFRWYDNAYADSDAWVKYSAPFPKQLKAFGATKAPSRFSAWKREFDGYVKKGQMPRFQIVRFPQDHTAGTRAGYGSPRAQVADNDYAVGQLVEAVSHSKFWKSTVICILEDDAQAGVDHVDCHRSPAYVISPFIKKGTVDSRFYNTDSMLRTMELMLGLPPMNQYDAVARPISVFSATADNAAPYKAVLPAKAIVAQVNKQTAYRSRDSIRLFPRFVPDPGFDAEQNDVLWVALMGKGRRR